MKTPQEVTNEVQAARYEAMRAEVVSGSRPRLDPEWRPATAAMERRIQVSSFCCGGFTYQWDRIERSIVRVSTGRPRRTRGPAGPHRDPHVYKQPSEWGPARRADDLVVAVTV